MDDKSVRLVRGACAGCKAARAAEAHMRGESANDKQSPLEEQKSGTTILEC